MNLRASFLLRCLALLGFAVGARGAEPPPVRTDISLDAGWRTIADETDPQKFAGFEQSGFDDHAWRTVDVPHNCDDYQGYRQVKHGQKHGYAWYRRTFTVGREARGRRIFLWFEGVGSYATVWVNGRPVGRHAGGLTTFTLDITAAVNFGGDNLVAVRADHPAGIRDLPWVCGGCERVANPTEGPQPFGIFRPVHLVATAPVRVEPFGVQVWNDPADPSAAVTMHVRTEVKNYGSAPRTFAVVSRLADRDGTVVAELRSDCTLAPGQAVIVPQDPPPIAPAHLWSLADPYLYTLQTMLLEGPTVLDRVDTTCGLRSIVWPDGRNANQRQFRLNGQPVFVNGVADYEHLLGANFAFTAEQIRTRVRQVEAAGFNAFRDAHHPHNLRYQDYWDRDGLLWWAQFGTHVWFDNDAFRANFKTLLREWVKERRNSPSLVLWGLQNESLLPTAFAQECAGLIRELDPTASSQRKITTCNGGTGTDWDVPQNWSGTYSGDPAAYAAELRRQQLVGEYGAWRSIDLHSEGAFDPKGILSEDRMAALLETKLRLAESVRDEVCGHFLWLLTTHANPGRNLGDQGEHTRDGIRELDQIGPANNKGLLTSWGEPLDAYYLYRSNYAPKTTQPMVYIVSHTWPDRWTTPGKKSGIVVYSNCDEVELFNDDRDRSLGRRTRGAKGTHFQWDDVEIDYNVLYAEGRVDGKVVATDCIVLHHLPAALHRRELNGDVSAAASTAPQPGQNYLYRVNCGGPDYVDVQGNRWLADRDFAPGDSWGSISWAADYPNLPPAFGSQRRIYDPIAGTADDPLFQTFRYGRDRLRYVFAVPDGDYRIELYFIEPWYGTGGGLDCTGWRLFDVAVNGQVMLRDIDLWREAGRARAVKKTISAHASGGRLEISFPRVASNQAVISALAISTADGRLRPPTLPDPLVKDLRVADRANAASYAVRTHLDTGDTAFGDAPGTFTVVPGELVAANWIQTASASHAFAGAELLRFTVTADADVYVARDRRSPDSPPWLADWDEAGGQLETDLPGGIVSTLHHRSFPAGAVVVLGGNAPAGTGESAMYTVIVKRRRPPPPAQTIENFSVSGGNWRAIGNLRSGQPQYGDGGSTFTTLPSALTECDWIRTDRRPHATPRAAFTVNDHVEVYVALDARMTARPTWLADWIDTDLKLSTSDRTGGRFKLVKQRFTPGAVVTLGGNGPLPDGTPAAMYSVIVRPVRPATLYAASAAKLGDGATLRPLPGHSSDGAVLLSGPAGSRVEWTVAVGAGDRYGLNFRYATAEAATVPMELSIIGRDGRVLRTDPLEFRPSDPSMAWRTLRTRTGSSINAGTYTFRLQTTRAATIYLDSLEVE